MNKGLSGKDINFFTIVLILYADGIVIFAESKDELQQSLDALLEYCNRYTHLGIVFSTCGSFSEAQSALSGQALKAIFQISS